jgi:hypothetical protein
MEALATCNSESAGPELTTWERILLHLLNKQGAVSEYDAPAAVTARGIGRVVGVERSGISFELCKMTTSGIVEWQLRHIDGGARSRAYTLTKPGLYMAEVVRDAVGIGRN